MSESEPQCQLFGWFGVTIQVLLGIFSFSVLFYKRSTENPKRRWRIWFMDTLKQIVSQLLAHFLNVAISLRMSTKQEEDPCLWYFATIMLDTTIGMLICVGILRMLELTVFIGRRQKYRSGNYYELLQINQDIVGGVSANTDGNVQAFQISQPKTIAIINYWAWTREFLLWNSIVVIMKSLLFVIQDLLSSQIMTVTEFLMGWITNFPKLELLLVMFLVPLVMNALAFWVQDNFLMKKRVKSKSNQSEVKSKEEIGSHNESIGNSLL